MLSATRLTGGPAIAPIRETRRTFTPNPIPPIGAICAPKIHAKHTRREALPANRVPRGGRPPSSAPWSARHVQPVRFPPRVNLAVRLALATIKINQMGVVCARPVGRERGRGAPSAPRGNSASRGETAPSVRSGREPPPRGTLANPVLWAKFLSIQSARPVGHTNTLTVVTVKITQAWSVLREKGGRVPITQIIPSALPAEGGGPTPVGWKRVDCARRGSS